MSLNRKNSQNTEQAAAFRDAACFLLYLILRCLNDIPPDTSCFDLIDKASLAAAARYHELSALTAWAMKKTRLKVGETLLKAEAKAVRKSILLDSERGAVTDALEKNGIDYALLKGSVLKELYPGIGTREMTDIDILVDPERTEDIRDLMEALGYTCEQYGKSNHDIYIKQELFVFEIHRALFNEKKYPSYGKYYRNAIDRSVRVDNAAHARIFKYEDFYVYLIAHMKLHFDTCGIGLRALLDVYLFRKRYGSCFDEGYIRAQLEQMDADLFERDIAALTEWIAAASLKELQEIPELDYFIFSGAMGTRRNYRIHRFERFNAGRGITGKAHYLRDRLHGNDERIREDYPFLSRYRLLRPVITVRRFAKKPKKAIKREVMSLMRYRSKR